MNRLFILFVMLPLSSGLLSVHADTPVQASASPADFKPNIAKFAASSPREI